MPPPGGQPSSARLALLAGVANLVVLGAVGTALLLVRDSGDGGTTQLATATSSSATTTASTSSSRRTSTTTTTSSSVAPGSEVTGPAGIRTVIPEGWTVAPTRSAGSVQATDPADSSRYVRYGGSAVPNASILDSHLEAESDFAAARPGYSRVELAQTTIRGYEAIVWEFEWTAPEGKRHVKAEYWRASGTEYFVYASSKAADWPEMVPILTAMTENAIP
ncbi:hypothetical protein [Amycolatopsis thermoflava]|uniref:hypothetical protein n=1 Tax=Amycolatopsis thermoflava TaxID=84480 RepID=UPI001E5A4BFC|nr:hypothetical protein [Amycolatopsis thermoflava]